MLSATTVHTCYAAVSVPQSHRRCARNHRLSPWPRSSSLRQTSSQQTDPRHTHTRTRFQYLIECMFSPAISSCGDGHDEGVWAEGDTTRSSLWLADSVQLRDRYKPKKRHVGTPKLKGWKRYSVCGMDQNHGHEFFHPGYVRIKHKHRRHGLCRHGYGHILRLETGVRC